MINLLKWQKFLIIGGILWIMALVAFYTMPYTEPALYAIAGISFLAGVFLIMGWVYLIGGIILLLAKSLFDKYPRLRPVLRLGKRFVTKPKFAGWGMTTIHDVPWKGDIEFIKTCVVLQDFEMTKDVAIPKKKLNEMYWRFWVIKRAIDYS